MSRFVSPGIKPGPHTECFACGAPRREHRNGECPVRCEICGAGPTTAHDPSAHYLATVKVW